MAIELTPKAYLARTRTYLFARETPLLKEENRLCKFLEELDKAEEKNLAKDDEKVAKMQNDHKLTDIAFKFLLGCSLVGFAAALYESKKNTYFLNLKRVYFFQV